ncbi:MAG: FecR domain-containing protein [Monoglobales bacterium]
MNNNEVKNTVRTFFEKEASGKTQSLFAKWFRLDENQAEKDEAMKDIWENSPSVVSEQTWDDLEKIEHRIGDKPKKKNVFLKIASYAAILALLIASTVYITYKVAVPAPLEYTQVSVSYGESKKITLSDGTVVAVNAGSTLIYPEKFTADTRTVFLTGEANFSVAKNPDKPFIVKTQHIDIEALGTKFYVQSYPNTQYTKATLIEGSIKVDINLAENEAYILKPNNQLVYLHSNNEVSVIDVDAVRLASWEDGYLIFQGASFDEIVQTLERKYNVEINYDGKINQQAYYVKFNPDESLQDAMDVLTILIDKSDYQIENSKVYFHFR